jgi:hypothetical protein
MTFLVTEFGAHGVAMVAESGVLTREETPYTNRIECRLTFGARKVIPVKRLSCAVGFWGAGVVETNEGKSHTPDVWITDFAETHPQLTTIEAFAQAVGNELAGSLRDLERPFGIHFAGGPPGHMEFWEVANQNAWGIKTGLYSGNLAKVPAESDLRPREGILRLASGMGYGTRLLNDFDRMIECLVPCRPSVAPLRETLRGRADFLSACVRFICDLEKSSGIHPLEVGGDLQCVTISTDGVILYQPPFGSFAPV